jgi:hypothetical protein
VSLWENMGADHVQDGGYFGTPVIVFPLGAHQVLAMFRENMPVLRDSDLPLNWRDTLDPNQVIAGNAYRNVVSQPSDRLASKLFVPASKDPSQLQYAGKSGEKELIRWRVLRRWSDEQNAPVRPVALGGRHLSLSRRPAPKAVKSGPKNGDGRTHLDGW